MFGNPRLLVLALLACVLVAPAQGQSPGLEDLVGVYRLALDADPRLRGQQFELEALRERRREDLAGLLPSVSFTGDVSRTRREQLQSGLVDDESITRDFTRSSFRLGLRQPLYDEPARYRLRRGDSEVDRGRAELEVARQGLVFRVAEAYVSALGAQSAVELSREEFAAVEASRERVEALYAERMAALTDLEEVRARRDRAYANVIRSEGELAVALERLSEITNVPHRRLAPLREEAQLPMVELEEGDAWVELAMTESPEIQAARQGLTSSELQIRAVRAERYPNLDLVASYSYLDDLDGTAFGRKLEDLALGVELRVPLYTGGGISAGVRGARFLRDREQESLEQVQRSVRGEVLTAYRALQSGRSEIAAFAQAVRSSERGAEAVETGFEAGLRSLVDVLDAQRDLVSARREWVQARHEYVLNLLALRRAAGVLDEDDIVAVNDLLSP